jgi:hypothetical protein
MNMQAQTDDKGQSTSLGFGRQLITSYCKKANVLGKCMQDPGFCLVAGFSESREGSEFFLTSQSIITFSGMTLPRGVTVFTKRFTKQL